MDDDLARLCYYCNEGWCSFCDGWDTTVIHGQIVRVPCDHGCTESGRKPPQRVIPDEIITRNSRNRFVMSDEMYIVLGYICPCGERVTIQRWKSRTTTQLPKQVTVVCSRGHVACFDSLQVASLDMWIEDGAA